MTRFETLYFNQNLFQTVKPMLTVRISKNVTRCHPFLHQIVVVYQKKEVRRSKIEITQLSGFSTWNLEAVQGIIFLIFWFIEPC